MTRTYPATETTFCIRSKGAGKRHIVQIQNCGAIVTNEMHMGLRVAVESLHTVDCGHTHNQTFLLKQGKVSVDRSQGQIRDLGFEMLVNRLRRGVHIRAS